MKGSSKGIPQNLLGTQALVVAADEIGIFLRNRVAVNRNDRLAGAKAGKFLSDAVLDDAERIDD